MADMTARLALEDRQFARAMNRAGQQSVQTARRMSSAFGLFQQRLLGGVAAYTSLTRVANLYARAAEEGRAANDSLAREFEQTGRASSRMWDDFKSDAAESVNTIMMVAGALKAAFHWTGRAIAIGVLGDEARDQYDARRDQREQDAAARAQEEDRRRAVDVDEEVARSAGRRHEADRIAEHERHRRRQQEINEQVGKTDAERARTLIAIEERRHAAAMGGIDREEAEENKKKADEFGETAIGLGRMSRGGRRQGTTTPGTAGHRDREVNRELERQRKEQEKANSLLDKIVRNTGRAAGGAVYA